MCYKNMKTAGCKLSSGLGIVVLCSMACTVVAMRVPDNYSYNSNNNDNDQSADSDNVSEDVSMIQSTYPSVVGRRISKQRSDSI